MVRWHKRTLFIISLLTAALLIAGCVGGGNGEGSGNGSGNGDEGSANEAAGLQGQVGQADPDIICEPGNPIMISTLEQLQAIGDNLSSSTHDQVDGYFALSNDIDASETRNWNDGAGFLPIGTDNRPFTACFDGRGFTIKGLYIDRPATPNVGLFGDAVQSDIRNVVLEDVDITGGGFTGGLVGRTNSTDVKNAHVSGVVRGGMQTGGLIGELQGGELANSSSSADVEAFGVGPTIGSTTINLQSFGGLVGKTSAASVVTHSFAAGNVKGQDLSGGLVGAHDGGLLTESYATGNVNGHAAVGGLIGAKRGDARDVYSLGDVTVADEGRRGGGLVGHNEYGELTNAFSVGAVHAGSGAQFIGGLAGEAYDTSTQYEVGARSYWNTETSGQPESPVGEGKTTAELQQQATFDNWDFGSVWTINEGQDYPDLQNTPR